MSTKQSKHTRTSADSETPKATRLGVDLVRPMSDIQEDYSQSSANKSEKPKAIRLGVGLARKLLRRPQDEHPDSTIRVDRIFYVHETNEKHELRRRGTQEDLRRPLKLDISRPLISPPPPDVTLMLRYRKRQADWKRRSMAMKNKHMDNYRAKRWSLMTWKIPDREHPPKATPLGSPDPDSGDTVKPLPVPPKKEATGVRDQPQSSHKRAFSTGSMRSSNSETSIKSLSTSSRKRATTFRDQRWSPATSPTSLDVIEEQSLPSTPVRTTHRHVSSAANIPRRHDLGRQVPKKSASTGMLRPQPGCENLLTVPPRPVVSTMSGQRQIHPALRTQPGQSSSMIDESHIHPALRTQQGPTSTTFDKEFIPPALRFQSPKSSSSSLCTLTSTSSTQPSCRPIPRVRIIPPSTLIDPDEIAAHAERAMVLSKPPRLSEQLALLRNMNATRATVCTEPLDLHPLLSNRAQDYVALQLPPLPPPKPSPSVYKRHTSLIHKHGRPRATKIENVEFRSPSGATAIRLISPPGLGALACGELWAGGKYKRHKTVKPGQVPEHHRFTMLPDFELDPQDSMIPVVSSCQMSTTSWCSCAEYDAWAAVTDRRWKSVGIGMAQDGRWVVELWEPDAGTARSR